jgi:hypothetical protein
MKEYHTKIEIKQPQKVVWDFLMDFDRYPEWNPLVSKITGEMKEGTVIKAHIVPLGKDFLATIVSYKEGEELIWEGVQGAKFLLTGKHYYQLKAIDANTTELLHGEYFTGMLSSFLSKSLLAKMEDAFVLHNTAVKKMLESKS